MLLRKEMCPSWGVSRGPFHEAVLVKAAVGAEDELRGKYKVGALFILFL